MFQSPIGLFRITGFIEGLSLLILLFIAMPLKYLAGFSFAVTIVGSLHGLFFVLYMLVVAYTTYKIRWSFKWLAASTVAAFIPFGNIILDMRLQKTKYWSPVINKEKVGLN
ncbi:DUF3817 domain-containing protein [Anaerobacillus sp. MEB173]|uniref:DUF3817 domain-containing protein n=1 Tax=Anaerobacillus sp. MEB173 TaxID=3383345 RepID=UPI003F90D529